MSEHTCHAIGCEMVVQSRLFMCRKHWQSLSYRHRTSILRAYRKGQEIDKRPSEKYLAIANEAIEYLRQIEGR